MNAYLASSLVSTAVPWRGGNAKGGARVRITSSAAETFFDAIARRLFPSGRPDDEGSPLWQSFTPDEILPRGA